MRFATTIITAALTVLLSAAYSQSRLPSLEIVVPSHPTVSVRSFDPVSDKDLGRILQRPGLSDLDSLVAVLVNNSDIPIMAIAVRWTYTDQQGQEHSLGVIHEGGFNALPARPVIAPRSEALVTPNGIFLAQSVTGGGGGGVANQAEKLLSASHVKVTIDAIIAANGLVLGSDSTGLEADIVSRRAAARSVAQVVREAVSNNTDVMLPLDNLAKNGDEPTARLAHRMMRMSSQRIQNELKALESLPELPVFFRN